DPDQRHQRERTYGQQYALPRAEVHETQVHAPIDARGSARTSWQRLDALQVPSSRATSVVAFSAAVVAQPAVDRVHIYLPEKRGNFVQEPASTPEASRIAPMDR